MCLSVCLSVCLPACLSGKSLQRCVQSSGSADLLLLLLPSAPLLSFSPSPPPRAAPCPVSYCVVTTATRPETVPAAHARLQSSFIIISSSPARDMNIREGPRRARAPPAGQCAPRPARAGKADDRFDLQPRDVSILLRWCCQGRA